MDNRSILTIQKEKLISQEYVKHLYTYNPDTGTLFSHKFNKLVGCEDKLGYLGVILKGKKFLLHRLVWLYMTGLFPDGSVDHINGDKKDNRWVNLRVCNHSQNCSNRKVGSLSTTGYKGVRRNNKGPKPYGAIICQKGKEMRIGTYWTKEEAAIAYNKKAIDLFGEFASLNIIQD